MLCPYRSRKERHVTAGAVPRPPPPPSRPPPPRERSARSDVAPPRHHVVRARPPIASPAPTLTLRSGAVPESRTPCGIRTRGPTLVTVRLFLNVRPLPKPSHTP